MLSFIHLGLQIFVGLLIVHIVHCRGENILIGVLRRTHHLIAAAFQTCCCYVGGLEKNKRLQFVWYKKWHLNKYTAVFVVHHQTVVVVV